MRDYRDLLRDVKCWDAATQATYEATGEAAEDCVLQNREELIGLCEFIEERGVRSYLEIGTWTGRLVETLHALFAFDLVAACDDGYCRRFGFDHHFPPDARVLVAGSRSPEFRAWREALGPIDLVLIDADHSHRGVSEDFALNRTFPHRFLALHDITGANRHTAGVGRFWRGLAEGHKREIVRPHIEIGAAESTMGVGIWWA